jgi:AcrR family transcriptional regulator
MASVSSIPSSTGADPPAQPVRKGGVRVVNPEANRRDIIDVATAEFAAHGLTGARVDVIASKTQCSKRLIYYYFGDKAGLYMAVLEHVYRRVRSNEGLTDFDSLPPADALRTLVAFRFDHHFQNPEFVRMVMIENVHNARFLKQSKAIHDFSAPAVGRVDNIYRRGVASGVFRGGLLAADIHWQISAMSFYNVSNRATFSTLFDCDLEAPDTVTRLRDHTIEAVLRFVAKTP